MGSALLLGDDKYDPAILFQRKLYLIQNICAFFFC
ncbi:hypothetical protein IMSAG013_01096 [Clostridiales bacterium]|nr:hypothetical protein IMSAG013_01096 [Clostridiales bacterium]